MKWLDRLLDRITMYRLVLYYLIALLAATVGLSAVHVLHFDPIAIVLSSLALVGICWLANVIFAYAFDAPVNGESALITGLILALIITPTPSTSTLVFLMAAGGLAMASKYMLAIQRRHIFNPAAVAVALTSLGAGDAASWWVGTSALLPVVVIGGLLVVRRIRRTPMVVWFATAALAATVLLAALAHNDIGTTLHRAIFSSAVPFAGFVMLTEPLTSPTTKRKQIWYALLTGSLFAPQIHVAHFYSTPELALLVGNAFTYVVGPRTKVLLHLKQRLQIGAHSLDLVFSPERRFAYEPGQYMEFTLPHANTDARGSRRYFTLASSPTEPDIHLGIKFYDPSSSYKQAMLALNNKTPIVAAQLGGDFVLPKDPSRKIVFIAGGIGITPYRSMVKYLLDTSQPRPIIVLYAARDEQDLAYHQVLETAREQLDIPTHYFLEHAAAGPFVHASRLSGPAIQQLVPDYHERLFYISGPQPMVAALTDTLTSLGVARANIKRDFFSGYA